MKYNLSEITDVIKDRRTVYPEFYSDRKVHKEQIERILNNAIWAPNHGSTQPWSFKVFMEEGRQKLSDFLSNLYADKFKGDDFKEMKFNKLKNRPMMAGAVIAVSYKKDPESKIKELEEIEAVACAIQNMYLTCTAWGLGSFWASPGLIYTAEMNEFLGLDKEDKCLALFYVGYPKPDYEWPKGHRKPIEYFTEWVLE
ncbi:nitroreductase [Paracrocinitomix mangrovi]|uniref:nitroreductase family protein n=1 Tax=Paracrocinitomix mangrovi TaxID=2862509 RepID=UPI001C8D4488|nr:nitroreductase [Paracrocinitomix mangrovi]UKN01451.1 nitroreductase [Paracrocinitomix mangrovi]